MRSRAARRSWLPHWPYLLGLLVALAAMSARYAGLGETAAAGHSVVVEGRTGQGTHFDLGISGRRILWLRTSLSARCRGGTSWQESWSPINGVQVHIRTLGGSFQAIERGSPRYPNGVVGRVAFTLRGTLGRGGRAQGTVRLVGRFYRGEREWNSCDTLDVPWATGPRAAARMRRVTLGGQIGYFYPEVPSLAGRVSPARARFIRRVDATCVRTYRLGERAQRLVDAYYSHLADAGLRDYAYYVRWHAWQLSWLEYLGRPPQARTLYDAWLENFRQRVLVERRVWLLGTQNRLSAARALARRLPQLKAQGNLLGQRFGLVRCTSNGDRTPVPILGDGQPVPLP